MEFVKYHGSGNDFLVVNKAPRNIPGLCHRRYGVGADGVLFWYKERSGEYRFHIFNADGSEAEMCGNGLRCVAHRIAQVDGLKSFRVRSMHRSHECTVDGADVTVELGPPLISLPIIDTGVPHYVYEGDSLSGARALREKYNANVTACVLDGSLARLRTYERGVEDETFSCGTGAAAAFVFLAKKYGVDSLQAVFRRGDVLHQRFEGDAVLQTGRVTAVYSGAINSSFWYSAQESLIGVHAE